MDVLVLDPTVRDKLLASRVGSESDKHDEVWDGVYVMSPLPNDEQQGVISRLNTIFDLTVEFAGLGLVRPGVNVTDREDDWMQNDRCPDVVVYLNGTTARNLGSHWLGGPDFLVEVVSEYDRSRDKLDFYAAVGSREVLLVDRFPWSLELHRRAEGRMVLAGRSTIEDPAVLASEVLPLTFRLVAGEPRPRVEVVHGDGVQRWSA